MVEGVANNSAKIILIAINFFVALFGAVVFGAALYANLSSDFKSALQDLVDKGTDSTLGSIDNYTTIVWVMCGFGAALFVIGVIGCLSATYESQVFLGAYFCISLLCTLAEAACVIAVFAMSDSVEAAVKKLMTDAFAKRRMALFKIEFDFHCCGTDGTTSSLGIPCLLTKLGCVQAVWDRIDFGLTIVGIAASIGVFFGIVAMVCAAFLFVALRKRAREVAYSQLED